MTCSDVRKLLPDLALGELDAEPAAAVAEHVKACAACRAEEGALGRTLNALRAARTIAPSTQRRSAAAAAMARAHAEQSEQLLVRRPRSWTPWATAAAFLLVLAAALTVRSSGTAFIVATLSGSAELRDRESGAWRSVLAGTKISVGDRLVTQPGCVVRLTSGAAELCLDQETWLEVVALRRVTLDRGRLLAVAPRSELLVITDMANNSAVVSGRVELSLREVTGTVLGFRQVKGTVPELPEPKKEIRKSLVAHVQFGEVALDGDRDQRLRVSAGQEGTFSFGGQPATAPMNRKVVGDWAD